MRSVLMALLAWAAQAEPTFEGKPVSHWMKLLRDRDAAVRQHGAVKLILLGAPAVPALLEAAKDPDADFRAEVVNALTGIHPPPRGAVTPLIALVKDPDPGVRRAAASGLGRFGSDAGHAAVELARVAVEDTDRGTRLASFHALGDIGPAAQAAAPALRAALGRASWEVRVYAATALAKVDPASRDTAVQALRKAQADAPWAERVRAAESLHAIDPRQDPAPLYVQALAAAAPEVRRNAAFLLSDLRPPRPDAAAHIQPLLKDPARQVRVAAAGAMVRLQSPPAGLVAILVDGLRDPERTTRYVAAHNLASMGPLAREAIPALREAARDPEPMVQQAAQAALTKVQGAVVALAGGAKPVVLVADGSKVIQQVVALTLEDHFQVQAVADGETAVATVGSVRPVLVIAAVTLDVKSGYDVCAFIKGQKELAQIPVLLTWGSFETFDEARAAKAGCDGRLMKPWDPPALLGKVQELVAKPGAR